MPYSGPKHPGFGHFPALLAREYSLFLAFAMFMASGFISIMALRAYGVWNQKTIVRNGFPCTNSKQETTHKSTVKRVGVAVGSDSLDVAESERGEIESILMKQLLHLGDAHFHQTIAGERWINDRLSERGEAGEGGSHQEDCECCCHV